MATQMGLLIRIVMVTLIINCCNAAIYKVGDEFGWNIPPNSTFYSDWASTKTFQIGDKIEFFVSEENQCIGEVLTVDEYNNCKNPGLVFCGPNFRFTPTLQSNGSRFFISTVDNQCEIGMKVIITVGSPTNVSSTVTSSSTILRSLSLGSLFASALSTIVVVFFNYA